MSSFYQLPISCSSIISQKELARCTLRESIAQNLRLILITNFEEFRFDPSFGCSIWEEDFEILQKVANWKDKIAKSIEDALVNYEDRLTDIKVSVDVGQKQFTSNLDDKVHWIKKRIDIDVHANMVKTAESYRYIEVLFISPISLD